MGGGYDGGGATREVAAATMEPFHPVADADRKLAVHEVRVAAGGALGSGAAPQWTEMARAVDSRARMRRCGPRITRGSPETTSCYVVWPMIAPLRVIPDCVK